MNTIVKTPLMRQYNSIKTKHPDAILLFRVGDFYETFSTDAIKTAEILGITLTKRANGSAQFVELAGFPYHSLDTYLPKLVRAGQRVAICEQLEDPKLTKNIVKRGVTEMITPGVSFNDNVLNHKENNYLACVNLTKNAAGVAFLDISTGEFFTTEGTFEYVDKLLNSFSPKEVLLERTKKSQFEELFGTRFYTYVLEDWVFTSESATERLLKQFDAFSLKGFGIDNLKLGVISAGAILQYLDLTHHEQITHITQISRIEEERYVWLDRFTIRNLELISPINSGGTSLLDTIDRTQSAMGGRLLRRWLTLPLKDIEPINERLEIVDYFSQNPEFSEIVEANIKKIGDLERIISKIALQRATPREVVHLKNSLFAIEPIKTACETSQNPFLLKLANLLNPCKQISERIEKEIVSDPANQIGKGKIVADNVLEELDELRNIAFSGKDYLNQLQIRQAKITGISSLKIGYNNVFGYFFEVTHTHKNRVPATWIRKQTLVNAERYINEELKEYETKILGAEDKILALETKIFTELVASMTEFIAPIQMNAAQIAQLDCLLSFSKTAKSNSYNRPQINDSLILDIKQARHPVIEKQLAAGDEYIANDVYLDNTDQQVIIITGPNMSGKSALLRQTALVVLMAQMGSFVPALSANIGIVDKIFTRVGASDNISAGESTFMVEMNEAASILNNMSNRSLILFDELGRGTSTYDGISIAWAIVEYINQHPSYKPKTLFATHYHELNEMEKLFSGIKNFNVSVKELGNKVLFLRKLIRGGSEHSFGIHVAQMAGMPKNVVQRANEILKELENSHQNQGSKEIQSSKNTESNYQMSFYSPESDFLAQIRDEILSLDLDQFTPLQALNKLQEIKKMVGK